ncbi:MAG: DNA-3-methyladenine glycosylase 2 family protein [Alphaproteobacteria bacterium]|nr:DNA-3-methyladenine glycosylase 2 family protein [Alphaproteobacteria bacterium]
MEYKKHLSKDKILKPLVKENDFILDKKNNILTHMIRSVISQQLSTKVAAVIYDRFLNLYNHRFPTCDHILDTPFNELKSIGLSKNKTQYVYNVAQFFLDNHLQDKMLHKMTNDQLIELLTQIKGIGKWSVQMLLMFVFGREDVFAIDDLGIKQTMVKLYNIQANSKKDVQNQLLLISDFWKPYRTYACLHLWHHKDN